MKTPTMYDEVVEFAGIKLKVDPINRKRTEGDDNVMAIFQEEQPFTWEFSKPHIIEGIEQAIGEVDFADVGCGSGVFSILVAKHLSKKLRVVAIDKSQRAIFLARENAQLNSVRFILQEELYQNGSLPRMGVKVMGIYPPYHLYPKEIEEKIPQHARGGSDGQEEFRNQLSIANYHLAPNGIIFFNQMCLGDESGPRFLYYIPGLIDGASIKYVNVLPPISTEEFLSRVYNGRHRQYVEKVSRRDPMLYYTVGIICRDKRNLVRECKHNIDLKGRSWEDRIRLHWEIAQHEFK